MGKQHNARSSTSWRSRFRECTRVYNTCASPSDAFDLAPHWTTGRGIVAVGTPDGRHVHLDYEAFHECPEQLAKSLLQMGINAMKVWPFDRFATAGGGQYISPVEVEQGVDTVRRIRGSVADRMDIAVDLTGQWSLASAVRIARALEPYRVLLGRRPCEVRSR